MGMQNEEHRIADIATLERYTAPVRALARERGGYIHPHYRALIAASPFVVLATCGPDGHGRFAARRSRGLHRGRRREDAAHPRPPRQQPHRQHAQHPREPARRAALPDPRRRRDAARERTRPHLDRARPARTLHHGRQAAALGDRRPRRYGVLPVLKAIIRSKLWDASRHVDRKSLPSTGTILSDLSQSRIVAEEYDKAAPERLKTTLY